MKLIVHLKPSFTSLELSRRCDASSGDESASGLAETVQSMRVAVEQHVLACQEMVKRAVPRGTRVDALPGMHVLIVDSNDNEIDRERIEASCEYVTSVSEDFEMELIA